MSDSFLKDQVVLVIGASRAPAPALALALAKQGAVLALNDLSPVRLDPLAEAIRQQEGGQPGRVQTYIADATRGMPLRAMLDEILSDWGRIDILINNPRIAPNAPLLSMDEWDWQRTIEMNLNGPFLVTQIVARLMQEQGRGTIINIIDDHSAALQSPGQAAYAASQQALLAFSQAAAREFLAYNIQVITLCPDEELFRDSAALFSAPSDTDWTDQVLNRCATGAVTPAGQIDRVGQTKKLPETGASRQEPHHQE